MTTPKAPDGHSALQGKTEAELAEETCMCGDPIEGHSTLSGHSPLSMADYDRLNTHCALTARIEELEGALRACHQQMREWDGAMDLDLRSDAEIQKWCEARERARTALENRK